MPLVAIYYHNTASNHVFGRTSTTTSVTTSGSNASNSSSKWKKGLAILSTKYQQSKKYLQHHNLSHHHVNDQLLVAAAATEKVLCHVNNHDSRANYSLEQMPTNHSVHFDNNNTIYYTTRSSSKVHQLNHRAVTASKPPVSPAENSNASSARSPSDVQCENLTAKEFAQMAGIKIKSAHDFESEQQQQYTTTTSSFAPAANSIMTTMTFISTKTALSTKSSQQQPYIWDSDFWESEKDGSSTDKKSSTCSSSSIHDKNGNSQQNLNTYCQQQQPFKHIQQSQNTPLLLSNEKKQNVIQKGRFKIVLGEEDDLREAKDIEGTNVQEPSNADLQQRKPTVVEWKRKRSESCVVINNIPKKRT